MLGTIGAIIGNGAKALLDFVRDTPGPNTLSLVLTLPPFITNLVATLLIGLKVWLYRKQVKSHLTTGHSKSTTTRAENVLLLLVESGFLYCAVWLLILIAGFDVMTAANNTLIMGIAVSLTGIYPTFIVIMVSLDKSHANTVFSSGDGTMEISQPLHFTHGTQSSESLPRGNKEARKDTFNSESTHFTNAVLGAETQHWEGVDIGRKHPETETRSI
jgi:hypothetical protein